MFIWKSTRKLCNPQASYTDAEGTWHYKVPEHLYVEVPEDAPPDDALEHPEHYIRVEDWEATQAPYITWTRREQVDIDRSEQSKVNAQALAYLASTDWYVVRSAETAEAIPEEVLQEREAARARIVKLPTA